MRASERAELMDHNQLPVKSIQGRKQTTAYNSKSETHWNVGSVQAKVPAQSDQSDIRGYVSRRNH